MWILKNAVKERHPEDWFWKNVNSQQTLSLNIEILGLRPSNRLPVSYYNYIYMHTGEDPGFQVRGEHLNKLRRAEGAA
jgi:hypothetical protein